MRPSHSRSTHRRGFTIRVVVLRELQPEDFAQWRELEMSAIEPYPQLSAVYWETALRERPDCAQLQLLIASDRDGWAFLSPITTSTLSSRVPIRTLSISNEFIQSESARRYPLMHAGRGVDALSAVLSSLPRLGLPSLLVFEAVDDVDALTHAIHQGAHRARGRVLARHRYQRAVLQIEQPHPRHEPGSTGVADFIPRNRSAESRRKTGRVARRLVEALGGQAPVLTERTDEGLIEDFLRLQSRGWKGDPTRGGEGYGATGQVEWYRAFTAAYLSDGRLIGYEIASGTRQLYLAVGVRMGSTVFGLQDAYDEEFRAFEVGRLSRQAVVNRLGSSDIRLFDPNLAWHVGEAARVYPNVRGQREMILGASPFGRLAISALAAVKRMRSREADGEAVGA
ncbi:GNAT family N-acetyltransferase [Microbacterium sp. CPCC 204701]|uniref:GNAT family N-acetyltransferase n=1 Tax=Microbacterium sp. CPCC 204701 TaxID=2493084 RepID=UPI0013E3A11B|nr:GNAT family N-acetyltransferase [Microbacterium sp. CPCC 204701]